MILQRSIFAILLWCSSAAAQGFPAFSFPPGMSVGSPPVNCDMKLTTPGGSFQSPNYPSVYPDNLNCEYSIEVKEGHKIEITFHDFAVDIPEIYEITKVRGDYVLIVDGDEDESEGTYFHFSEPSLQFGPPHKFTSESNSVRVIFRSDIAAGNRGFNATYKSLSPNYCLQWDLFQIRYVNTEKFLCEDQDPTRENYFKTCKISCLKNYRMTGSSRLTCENGAFTPQNPCAPIRWIVHQCDYTNMKYCPYSEVVVAEFLSESSQRSKDLSDDQLEILGLDKLPEVNISSSDNDTQPATIPGEEDVLSRSLGVGSGETKAACTDEILNFSYCKKRGNTSSFLFKCGIFFLMKRKLNKDQATQRMGICFRCRGIGCVGPISYA